MSGIGPSKPPAPNHPSEDSATQSWVKSYYADKSSSADQDFNSTVRAKAFLSPYNVKYFGARGDGVSDDTLALRATAAAVSATGGVLYIPRGTYRVKTAGNALTFSGVSNVGVYFDPGAQILMDNLSGSTGTGHGIAFIGGGSNVWVVNGHVEWNSTPTRSLGHGYFFQADTSSGDPATNPISNAVLADCYAVKCPQVGAMFQGAQEVRVTNFEVKNNLADGCHFNACHRINVDGVKGYNTGDDTLAFVTYWDINNQTNHFSSSVFFRAGLGDWCNSGVATNVYSENGTADGVRIAFANNLSLSNVTVWNKQTVGIVLDTAAGVTLSWGASQGVSIDNVVTNGCAVGIQADTLNATFTDSSVWWQYDVQISNFVARGCSNHSLYVNDCAGFSIDGVRSNGNDVTIQGRDHTLDNIYCEGDNIFIAGQATAYANLAATDKHNITVGQVHAKGANSAGGTVQLSDIGSVSVGTIRSTNSQGTGVQIFRAVNVNVDQIHVTLPNRANGLASSNRGLLLQKILHGDIQFVSIDHDANNLNSLEIGGGDATDIAAKDLRIQSIRYVNTINQALNINNVVLQGTNGPSDFIYKIRWYNGGFATPAWSHQWFGNTSWVEQFMGSGAPAITAPIGSTYQRTDGGPGTGVYVKTAGSGASTGWTVVNTTNGGGSTQTPGAVTTVTIAHGLGVAPTRYSVQPTNANARGAPAFFLTADATNLTLNFASALTAATSYSWVWTAGI